ncbi:MULTISPECIES: HlyD family secretion protein [Sphingomonadaceae]|uniref:HlyD family efflux transporter periplasmic adaptor subunit n=2 Tax=Sphingomonadaceae TaxID=41297 RepID=A0A3G2UMC9_SPHYA|nr:MULTISPECIES: HlyD family efflux transporter periplasmic adaptor subunit [Sphingomonadaceae]AYO75734.1 HlyD family efflux transporter periplasmic adaptor subunit [Sphingobium yanoikuyae]MDG2515961.1 HlyD family efflux transporter periplasmic adaptor subunit [Sphingobium yanoikuyae]QSR19260.1 glycoside hydrolase family 43 [Novosphingobium sp. KA1]
MTQPTKKTWLIRGGIVAAVAAIGLLLWSLLKPSALPEGIVGGNGRIEALEIDIAAKSPGRIRDIVKDEGELVNAGDVVAHMDVETLNAQLSEAQAQLAQALNNVQIAETQVGQRQSEHAAAVATVRQREAELNAARKRLARSETLAREGATPAQERDDNQAAVEGAAATVEAAKAQLASTQAGIAASRSQVIGARSNVDAARATIVRIKADINDADLRAPRGGRIQYRVAQPGEVVAGGGRVMNLVDLSDVYMTFFLPETTAGRVGIGSEVRLVLDAAPQYVIPAKISFVADVAQFTPKSVETESERQKLMFRVRAKIDPALLRRHIAQVKTGLPGMAYVRVDPNTPWPASLSNLVKE